MLIAKSKFTIFFYVVFLLVFIQDISSQEETKSDNTKTFNELRISEVRGTNALSLGIGTSVMNGDLSNPMFEIYSHIGYKRFLGSSVAINLGYHKFNLAYEDVFNEGFMSFDLNLEWYLSSHRKFTPFIFAGGGYHAANYFETTETKAQGGLGFEVLVTDRVGLKLFADYNYMFTDELEGVVFGASDDAYWRVAIGLNIYFGNFLKNKFAKKIPTVINSNQLADDY